MDIKIVTMNHQYNFGAMLQAYALQETLKKLENSVQFIDQRKVFKKKVILRKARSIKQVFYNLSLLYSRNEIETGYRRFEEFNKEFMDSTEINYSNYETLKANPPSADVFVTGSDQVWNPTFFEKIKYLEFVNDSTQKISYAASIGVNTIPKEKHDEYYKLINRMDAISVRESTAKKLLQPYVTKQISVNIDPVFLLDKQDWNKISKKPSNSEFEEYVLCYILYKPVWLNSFLKKLHIRTGLKIINISSSSRNIYSNMTFKDAGPREFLWLFENAKYILTSSFHGASFAILFNKPFYVIADPTKPMRIVDLIKLFNLPETQLSYQCDNFNSYCFPEISFNEANEIIIDEQKRALEYFIKSLQIKPNKN